MDAGATVRALRSRLGLSQERLAALLGVSFASVNRWEGGAVRPSRRALDRIADLERTLEAVPARAVAAQPAQLGGPANLRVIDGVRDGARIPVQLTSFVGRDQVCAELAAILERARLVTLTGPGGSGKTRLAIEVARTVGHAPAHRRWFVPLSGIVEPGLVGHALAAALAVRERAGEAIRLTLAREIGTEPALLVMDNGEHVVEGLRPLVRDLLRSCPGLQVLATSQVPIGLSGERRFPVPPLAATVDGAIRLFADRATFADPAFRLADVDLEGLRRLCSQLDGLPLAIELAAAWVPTLTIDEMLGRMDDRLGLLVGGPEGDNPRHRTMRETVEWSRARLAPAAAGALDLLGVFEGPFDLEAAAAVIDMPAAAVAGVVRDLVAASLVSVEQSGSRTWCRLLETLKELARERLRGTDEQVQVSRRHADHFASIAEAGAAELTGSGQSAAMTAMLRHEDDFRTALGWSAGPGGIAATGLRLVAALGRVWYVAGRLSEGLGWIERFAGSPVTGQEIPEASSDALDRWRATALYHGAMLAAEAGRYSSALSWGAEAERLFAVVGDELGAARAMTVQGSAAKYVGDAGRAEERYAAALAVRRRLGDEAGIGVSLNNLGVLATERGAYASARVRLAESLAIKRTLGDERGIAVTLLNLGDVAVLEGDADEGERLARQSLDGFAALGDQRGIGFAMNNLGEAARFRRRHGAAGAWFARSLETFRAVGDERDVALALVNLGRSRMAQGDLGEGLDALREALVIARRIGDGRRIEEAETALAAADARPGQRDRRATSAPAPDGGLGGETLSPRELEVLEALADGLSNKEIAARLSIAVATVERHVVHVYGKLGVSGRVAAAAWALGRRRAAG